MLCLGFRLAGIELNERNISYDIDDESYGNNKWYNKCDKDNISSSNAVTNSSDDSKDDIDYGDNQ